MSISEKLYKVVAGNEDDDCNDSLSEKECEAVPQNFLLNSLNGWCTKLAEQLVSPSVTLPWLLSFIGAPMVFTSFLVPIKNAGTLLPQLIVSARIRSFSIRKYFWASAGFLQGLLLLILSYLLSVSSASIFPYLVLLILLFFSMASGVGSIAFKDVLAKTIPKGKRGRLLGVRATGEGFLTLLAGLFYT